MAKDYYETLGVSRKANLDQIRNAYRRLAKVYHPDVNLNDPQAEAQFKLISEAYATLSNPVKRARYDRAKRSNQNGQVRKPRPRSRTRGKDVEQTLHISLHEAYHGTERQVVKGSRKFNVTIPSGSASGHTLHLIGEGEASRDGGEPGDLYLLVEVEPDRRFVRDGDDLNTEVKIDMFTALLGGEIEVETLARPVIMKVPPGVQSGQRFRFRGKGMPLMGSDGVCGDLYVRALITIPCSLSPEQIELVRQLRWSIEQ